MIRKDVTKVRVELAETLNRVAYSKERVIVERHGKPVAAVVPIEDLEALEALEERLDVQAARKVMKETGELSLAEVMTKAGLAGRVVAKKRAAVNVRKK